MADHVKALSTQCILKFNPTLVKTTAVLLSLANLAIERTGSLSVWALDSSY